MKVRAAVLLASGMDVPYGLSQPVEVRDIELDSPGVGELLVQVMAAGICHSDLSVVDGARPRPLPMVLGHEASGIVSSVGPGVTDVAPGDHVVLVFVPRCGKCRHCVGGRVALCEAAAAANGSGTLLRGGRRLTADGVPLNHHLGVSAFSEYAVVDRSSAVLVGKDIPFDVAALMGCALLTGVGAVVNAARLNPGDSVAVWGLGGVGLSAVMGAVAAGAGQVIAIDPVASKRELALSLGAHIALDPQEHVRDIASGGVDIAIEAVGRPETLLLAYEATTRGGTTVSVSLPRSHETLTISAVSLVVEERTLKGSYLGSSNPNSMIPELVRWWRDGRLPIEQLVAGTVGLEQINEAMDALATGRVARQILRPHEPNSGTPVSTSF